MADQDARRLGWEKLNGEDTRIGDRIQPGIDGVYANPRPPPPYIIAEAKYGSAGLGTTKRGVKQMSPEWIDERLEALFGEDRAKDILRAGYARVVQRIDKYGNVTLEDTNGNVVIPDNLSKNVWREG